MRHRFSLRSNLRGFFQRHPGVAVGLGLAAMTYLTVLSFLRLIQARGTVHGDWGLTVAAGLAASPALIAVAAGVFWWAHRRRADMPQLTIYAAMVFLAIFLLGLGYTRSALAPAIGPPEKVTTPFQLGVIAFMTPVYCGIVALLGWTSVWLVRNRGNAPVASRPAAPGRAARLARPAQRLTGFISPGKRGWAVTWVADGSIPHRASAPTLTATADEATAAAARLYLHQPAITGAELQLAICPGPYRSGPILQVTGEPGAFTATDPRSGKICQGAALEDLIAAHLADGPGGNDFMLHWTRPIAALPLPLTGHPPASAH